MKKLLATDLDGTLLKDDKTVSNETIEIIKKMIAEGHYFVISTGRPFHRIEPIIQMLGIKSDKNFCICFNGGLITTTDNSKVIYEEKLKKEEVVELINLAEILNISIMVYLKEVILIDELPDAVDYLKNLSCVKIVENGKKELLKQTDVYKIIYIGSKEVVEDAKNKIPQVLFTKYNFTRSSDNYLEITSKNVTKGNAILKLAAYLCVDYKNTIAVGDEENDLSMLEKVFLSCCVSNANPKLKGLVDYVTLSNELDGVRHVIEKFVLNEGGYDEENHC